ncbi:PREDICTED: uncharacterized protein LOC106314296 [Brassica oleracea var. oleracea]|uniref:uncharacterized protein LOC106314296 n=1 Tax=Brassica oleracea var. oleracea TaxID=109376 RepID=UPI0006A6ACFC|nr:PREDICTED: uncharacterized protein LOC106314296 [Brassica oleracea var. oleracea]
MVNARQYINHIHYLIDEDWVRHESQDEIQNLCVSYFTNLLGKPVEPALFIQEDITSLLNFSCSPSQQADLISPFTSEDIRSAFFSLPHNKASGQDGYTPDFFMSYWYVVGGEVTAAVAEFFNSGHLLKHMNATNLALIPKIPNASKNSDFRPISCQSQSSFLLGRLLSENIILATKIVHGYNTNNVDPSGMLKVDLRKAFDTLRWDFVIADLRGINIPELYMAGSTNVSALRHSLSLSTATPGASSRVHRDFVRATHSLHTYLCSPWRFSPAFCDLDTILDDVMMFFDGGSSSLHGIAETLDDFASWSGLSMNKDKTQLFHAGLSEEETSSLTAYGTVDRRANAKVPSHYGWLGINTIISQPSIASGLRENHPTCPGIGAAFFACMIWSLDSS